MADPTIKFRAKTDSEGNPAQFIPGLPARSLTQADYDALDTDQRKQVRESPLYDYQSFKDATTASATPAVEAPPQVADEAAGTPVEEPAAAAPDPATVSPDQAPG